MPDTYMYRSWGSRIRLVRRKLLIHVQLAMYMYVFIADYVNGIQIGQILLTKSRVNLASIVEDKYT